MDVQLDSDLSPPWRHGDVVAKVDGTERTPAIGDDLFEQLDLPDPSELRLRVDLAVALTREIRDRRLTQAEAAEILGVKPSDISMLMSGGVGDMSVEDLARLLNSIGGVD